MTTDPALLAYREHIRHSGAYPFGVVACREDSAASSARRNRRNACVLGLESSGDETRGERGEDAAVLSPELQRVEAKLNVALELLGRVLEAEIELPPRIDLRFNAYGIEWRAESAFAERSEVMVRLHLEACPALPLELRARVVAALEPGWTAAVYRDLPPTQMESLERLVFRAHRREIAQGGERG